MLKKAILATLVLGIAATLAAHPHYNKKVSVKISDTLDVSLAYNSADANMERASKAEAGTFITPRRPSVTFSGDAMSGATKIAAGEYTVGVIKGDGDWTMALHPKMARGDEPDMAKVIKLDSMFSESMGSADHMLIDVTAGNGKFAGKPVLTIHFGSLYLAGVLQ